MLTTRIARISDALAIAELQLESWTDRGIHHLSPPDLQQVAAEWATAIRDQQELGRIIVVEKGAESKLVGCAGVMRSIDPRQCELILLEVAPTERRQKIGSRLVNASADIANGFGADSINAWIETNEVAAISLLESAGWQRSGAQRQKVGADGETSRNELELHTSLM